MQRSVLTCLLCCAPLLAWAGTNSWTALGPAGGYTTNIVFSPATDTVFAIGESGLYRSLDGGVSWQSVKSDFISSPQGIAVDPSDPDRVYVVAPSSPGLFESTDGGATFHVVGTLPVAVTQGWQVAVGLGGQILYVTSGARVFHSSNRAKAGQSVRQSARINLRACFSWCSIQRIRTQPMRP